MDDRNFWESLLHNFPLVCAASGWLIAQLLKVFTGIFKLRKFSVTGLLFGTGGMPSSHSAAVCALAIACGFYAGWGSAPFAVSVLFAIIVMVDATGVRRETGEQSKVLNRIMRDLMTSDDYDDIDRNLKELVGHTPLQVAVGALVGIAIPFLMSFIPIYRDYCVFL